MPRAPCTFRQRDLARAIRAIASAGVEGRVEIGRDGKMVVVIARGRGSLRYQRANTEQLTETARQELAKVARLNENLLLQALSNNPASWVSDLAKELNWFSSKNAPHKSKVHRTLARLKKQKLVVLERDGYTITERGQNALEKASQ